MRFLVTGTTGYLGGALARELLARGHAVSALNRRSDVELSGEPGFSEVCTPDGAIFDCATLAGDQVDRIIHVAALANAAACEKDPEHAHAVNVWYTGNLVRWADARNIHLTFVSTDLVFEGAPAPSGGYCEGDTVCPKSRYAVSKAAAEEVVLARHGNLVVRTSLLFGPPVGLKSGPLGWMIADLNAKKQITLFSDEWRTPASVFDAARWLADLSIGAGKGTVHIAGPERLSRVEIGEAICDVLGFDRSLIVSRLRSEVPIEPPRAEDVSLNTAKAATLLELRAASVRELLQSLPGA